MRLPTITELQTILLEPFPCGTDPCIDPIFGPTASSFYWSAMSFVSGSPFLGAAVAWGVLFSDGGAGGLAKANSVFGFVRAVRGGL